MRAWPQTKLAKHKSIVYETGLGEMIFLIEYNRRRGEIVTIRTFDNSEKQKAEEQLLQLELELNRRGVSHEIVLLDAVSEKAVRRTHRRYFESLSELLRYPA